MCKPTNSVCQSFGPFLSCIVVWMSSGTPGRNVQGYPDLCPEVWHGVPAFTTCTVTLLNAQLVNMFACPKQETRWCCCTWCTTQTVSSAHPSMWVPCSGAEMWSSLQTLLFTNLEHSSRCVPALVIMITSCRKKLLVCLRNCWFVHRVGKRTAVAATCPTWEVYRIVN